MLAASVAALWHELSRKPKGELKSIIRDMVEAWPEEQERVEYQRERNRQRRGRHWTEEDDEPHWTEGDGPISAAPNQEKSGAGMRVLVLADVLIILFWLLLAAD